MTAEPLSSFPYRRSLARCTTQRTTQSRPRNFTRFNACRYTPAIGEVLRQGTDDGRDAAIQAAKVGAADRCAGL